jgi:hypothetical protein
MTGRGGGLGGLGGGMPVRHMLQAQRRLVRCQAQRAQSSHDNTAQRWGRSGTRYPSDASQALQAWEAAGPCWGRHGSPWRWLVRAWPCPALPCPRVHT